MHSKSQNSPCQYEQQYCCLRQMQISYLTSHTFYNHHHMINNHTRYITLIRTYRRYEYSTNRKKRNRNVGSGWISYSTKGCVLHKIQYNGSLGSYFSSKTIEPGFLAPSVRGSFTHSCQYGGSTEYCFRYIAPFQGKTVYEGPQSSDCVSSH